MMVHVAGGVVWNPEFGIAVVNQLGDSWSLPKGHIEEGETPEDAAFREITEETGIPREELTLLLPLGSYVRDRIQKHASDTPEPREIAMFFFQTKHETLAPTDPENPEARWVAPESVPALLTHPKDKEFFENMLAHIHFTDPSGSPIPLHAAE